MKTQNLFDNVLNDLSNHLNTRENTSVFGLSFGEKAVFLCNQERQIVFVSNSVADGIKLSEQMKAFGKTSKTVLSSSDGIFSLGTSTFGEGVVSTIDAMCSLAKGDVDCLVISPNALLQKFAKKEAFAKSILSIKSQQTIKMQDLRQNLINIGYERVDLVTKPAEFSIKGDVLTVFDILEKNPYKIEFFDDIIETISHIDTDTFKKIDELKKITIHPTSTYIFDATEKDAVFKKIQADFENTAKALDINEAIHLKTTFEEFKINFDANNFSFVQNFILPFASFDRITDYIDDDAIIVFNDVKQVFDSIKNEYKSFEEVYDSQKSTGNILIGQKKYFVSSDDVFSFNNQLLSFQQITTANRIFSPKFVDSFKSSSTTNYFGNFELFAEDMKYYLEFDNTVAVFAGSEKLQQQLIDLLKKFGVVCNKYDGEIVKNSVNILSKNLPYGAIFVEDKFVVVGTKELLKRSVNKKIASSNKKEVFTMPKIGDYVVHETHGVGLCKGIEKMKFSDYEKDYIILEYFGGDKLYLPTEQIGLISAYVSSGGAPKLNKLGSKDFEKTKTKVRGSLKELAFNLVELYRDRENAKGFKFEVDKKLFEEFENSFPYEETADQISAIKDILTDMTSGKVMDRIVCGDVGYGKTEVALRTAFVSAINGKQTAFLAPTTVLSEQHYNTAKSRFENFGITVECLNRFKTKSEQKEIIERLKKREIDIICGTHRLLSNDVVFKDLGLLILDEEQRFGVGDKEKIKRLKTNVDVLTLSATPIPRTLHMGLVGIRDISLITTPPSDRLPVQTTVCEYSDATVLQAIKRELARDGQVLIIYNKVESIYQFSRRIRDLIGQDVSIGVAHGQMEPKLLETEILNLYQGKTKILVSTTLIENGVDLPTANTLIIINADQLGLSQLYQLKGRVGRSKNLGYAYFTFDKDKALSEDAYKRLNAIMEFTELGSGFKIAMKDLEIRGCGNILGAEQSGHMAKVGYDMYCKILSEVVQEIKGQKQKEYKDIKLDVAINCYVPENFIENNENRFRIYESLKQINSKQSQQKVLAEIKDLFGNPPSEIVNLSFVARLRNLAREFDVKRISISRQNCLAEFYGKEQMLNKQIALSLKDMGIKVYFSQTGAVMNFMLSEYSVGKKLDIVCEVFENALNLESKKK